MATASAKSPRPLCRTAPSPGAGPPARSSCGKTHRQGAGAAARSVLRGVLLWEETMRNVILVSILLGLLVSAIPMSTGSAQDTTNPCTVNPVYCP
jgi:hypothetical protein